MVNEDEIGEDKAERVREVARTGGMEGDIRSPC